MEGVITLKGTCRSEHRCVCGELESTGGARTAGKTKTQKGKSSCQAGPCRSSSTVCFLNEREKCVGQTNANQAEACSRTKRETQAASLFSLQPLKPGLLMRMSFSKTLHTMRRVSATSSSKQDTNCTGGGGGQQANIGACVEEGQVGSAH